MKNLENNLLFKSINKNDLPLLLKCLQANKITYQKDQTIIHQGQSINEIGILLSGKAHIINDDYWGNQTIDYSHVKALVVADICTTSIA